MTEQRYLKTVRSILMAERWIRRREALGSRCKSSYSSLTIWGPLVIELVALRMVSKETVFSIESMAGLPSWT